MDIVEFLRARLDEDEVIWSRAADLDPDVPVVISVVDRPGVVVPGSVMGVVSPGRMLREVEAKRGLLDEVERSLLNDRPDSSDRLAADYIAECLVSVYADHPDYDPEWRVG